MIKSPELSWLGFDNQFNSSAFPTPFLKTFVNGRAEKCVSLVDFPDRGACIASRGLLDEIAHCAGVEESFQGHTIRKGDVEVFNLNGHPKAKRAYGWSHRNGKNDEGERLVSVLEIPPVTSPETAVKVAIAAEVRAKR